MNFWHIQMSQGLLDGIDKTEEEVIEILQEEGLIGTGEWKDNKSDQCRAFKKTMAKGDIVMVRAGQKPLALVQVVSDSAPDYIYENWRRVKVLGYYSKNLGIYKGQTRGTLERVSNTNTDTAKFIINWHNNILANMKTSKIADILKLKKQIILQGAPGTGKTYTTASLALSILDIEYDPTDHKDIMTKYNELVNKQIFFTTFHQSMDYEDFVEGLKPEVIDGGVQYNVESGIFKQICQKAANKLTVETEFSLENSLEKLKEECIAKGKITLKTRTGASFYLMYDDARPNYFWAQPHNTTKIDPWYHVLIDNIRLYYSSGIETKTNFSYVYSIFEYLKVKPVYRSEKDLRNYVLIIDEINRGNISKLFGELITLLEADKRSGGDHPISAILPYSKESFSIPSNLYIIGTMNTTDRSVGHIDYAVRRRFAFYTLKSSKEAIESFYNRIGAGDLKVKALELFEGINDYIKVKKSPELDLEDLMVGHSYFMSKSIDELKLKLEYEIIPLLKEYEKDGLLTLKEVERAELGQDWKIILS